MWDWLKSSKVPFRDIFWMNEVFKKYNEIYGTVFLEELIERNILENERIINLFKKCNVCNHYGQPYINTATVVGILRNMIKEYDKT